MRRLTFILPLIAAGAGVYGMYLRNEELASAFDAETGLVHELPNCSLMLMALAAAVFLFSLIFALIFSRKYAAVPKYEKAFRLRSYLGLVLFTLFGIAFAVIGVLSKSGITTLAMPKIAEWVFIIFAVLSGVAFVLLAALAYSGKAASKSSAAAVLSVVPAVFICYMLVILYKENSTNPVLLDFCYEILAFASICFALFYESGYAYGRSTPARTIVSHFLAVFFSIVAFPDFSQGGASASGSAVFGVSWPGWLLLLFALYLFINISVFLRNMTAVPREKSE